MKNSPRDEKTK